MKVLHICPLCGSIGYPVLFKTVENLIKDVKKEDLLNKNDYFLCTDKDCTVSYFSGNMNFTIDDIKVPVWYKSNKDLDPICYCSDLTRRDIKEAVGKGGGTISEVQTITGKNVTGQCLTRNPSGKCCREVFIYEINRYLKKDNRSDGNCCCCCS